MNGPRALGARFVVDPTATRALTLSLAAVLCACSGKVDDAGQITVLSHASRQTTSEQSQTVDSVALTPSDSASGELAGLKVEVATMRQELNDIRQQLARSAGTSPSSPQPGGNPKRDSLTRIEAERIERMRNASTESAFRNEKDDARWSSDAVSQVRAALDQADPTLRGQVRSIECRSTSCRVEVNSDASLALDRSLPAISSGLVNSMPNMSAARLDQGDGREATVLYFSR